MRQPAAAVRLCLCVTFAAHVLRCISRSRMRRIYRGTIRKRVFRLCVCPLTLWSRAVVLRTKSPTLLCGRALLAAARRQAAAYSCLGAATLRV